MVRVLLVEPDALFTLRLYQAISDLAEVRCVSTFAEARLALLDSPPDLLVTNLRLGAFNGLHLIHLAGEMAPRTRSVVYTERLDLGFGREVQRVGALYDTRRFLLHTLASYVGAALPPRDRRRLGIHERRQAFRGGRRSADRVRDGLTSNGVRITGRVR
jgi:DNA-binding NarL/FixJ family response regulator